MLLVPHRQASITLFVRTIRHEGRTLKLEEKPREGQRRQEDMGARLGIKGSALHRLRRTLQGVNHAFTGVLGEVFYKHLFLVRWGGLNTVMFADMIQDSECI